MRTKLALFLFCCFSAALFAQTKGGGYKVTGFLLDSVSSEPVVYATVKVAYKSLPQKAVRMFVTDTKGRFDESLPGAGEYTITFTSVGNLPAVRSFETTESRRKADLGTVYTREATEELGGVTVLAQKPLVKVEVDKIAYDVESDPDAQDKTVLDMLRKVPLVTVDGEDNIKLNGKTNFRIHLNGRPSNLLSSNPGKTLKSMPANSVKDIEVITSPGAKYDAEGVGGIINIVTQTGKGLEGYTATLNAGVSQYGTWNAGGSVMVKSGKLSVSGSYNHSYYRMPEIPVYSSVEYFNDPVNHRLNMDSRTKYRQPFDYGSVEASYEIDTLNLLTFTIDAYGGRSKQYSTGFTEMLDESGQPRYRYDTDGRGRQKFGGQELSLNYQRTLSKKEELLTASYRFSHDPSGGDTYRRMNPVEGVYPFNYVEQYNENDAHTNEHTAQVDYVNPFNRMHSLEAGLKFIYRDNYSKSDYQIKEIENDPWKPFPQDLSNFDHDQSILSAYAAYMLKYKDMGLKLGARLEHSKLNAKLHSDRIPDFDKKFTDVVPTVNLSFKLSDTQTLRAAYNMRISRPGIWYLNPYRDESSPYFVSYGNPDLESEKYQSVSLNYSNFTQRVMVNVSLSYDFCHNSIQQYNRLDEATGVVNTTYGNIGKQNNAGLGVYGNFTPFDGTNIWLNGMINYTDIRSSDPSLVEATAKGWQGGGSLGLQQNLPWKLQLSAYGGYYSHDIQLQSKGVNYFYYGLTIRRNFLKDDRLTISLTGMNFLNRLHYNTSTYTKDYYQWTEMVQDQRSVSLNVSFRLGDLRTVVKKVARGIVNDDLKSGGGSGGGQQGGGK